MIFDFKDNKLYLISNNIRMVQDINTNTKKPFKNFNEAKKWANEYFCKNLEFIEEKIDIKNLVLLSQLDILSMDNEENKENIFNFRIHNYDTDKVIFSKECNSLSDLNSIDVDELNLNKGKYYFTVSNLIDVFFKKENISFIIE